MNSIYLILLGIFLLLLVLIMNKSNKTHIIRLRSWFMFCSIMSFYISIIVHYA